MIKKLKNDVLRKVNELKRTVFLGSLYIADYMRFSKDVAYIAIPAILLGIVGGFALVNFLEIAVPFFLKGDTWKDVIAVPASIWGFIKIYKASYEYLLTDKAEKYSNMLKNLMNAKYYRTKNEEKYVETMNSIAASIANEKTAEYAYMYKKISNGNRITKKDIDLLQKQLENDHEKYSGVCNYIDITLEEKGVKQRGRENWLKMQQSKAEFYTALIQLFYS